MATLPATETAAEHPWKGIDVLVRASLAPLKLEGEVQASHRVLGGGSAAARARLLCHLEVRRVLGQPYRRPRAGRVALTP